MNDEAEIPGIRVRGLTCTEAKIVAGAMKLLADALVSNRETGFRFDRMRLRVPCSPEQLAFTGLDGSVLSLEIVAEPLETVA